MTNFVPTGCIWSAVAVFGRDGPRNYSALPLPGKDESLLPAAKSDTFTLTTTLPDGRLSFEPFLSPGTTSNQIDHPFVRQLERGWEIGRASCRERVTIAGT